MIAVEEKLITVSEFLEREDFEEGYLYELINGEIVRRASPDTDHQLASANLEFLMQLFIREKNLGTLFHAPYDVIFNEINMEQPDVIFVSNANKSIIKKGCIVGVPDLLVEILSPGTGKNDREDKFDVYRKSGVREYWLVNPKNASIKVYTLKNGKYEIFSIASAGGEVESKLLSGLKISLTKVFSE